LPQPRLPHLQQQGPGQSLPHGWSSKERGIRYLRCTTCSKNFSQRIGTRLFRTHLTEDKSLAIAQHLAEGNSMRSTSRLTGVNLNTFLRFAHRLGDHAQEFHE
jgi:transposase-like protein